MQDTAAAHKAGMFQANAGKKSGDSNDSSQECEEHNAFEVPVDFTDTSEETDDSTDASKKSVERLGHVRCIRYHLHL